MTHLLKQVPIPTAGLALGLAALGNLLMPVSPIVRIMCGCLSAMLVILLLARVAMFPKEVLEDFRNPIFASVSGTFFMTLMQLATYIAPVAYFPALGMWWFGVVGHAILICWFTAIYIASFDLADVYPTYFICYVGIIVGAVTSPTFGLEAVGRVLVVFGLACYLALLVVVTLRYMRHPIPEPARPLFCIYAAPMSLFLAGYLTVFAQPHMAFCVVVVVLAQALYVGVLTRLPDLLRLKFYPSYAAMTFPFVITAVALGKVVAELRAQGLVLGGFFDVLIAIETIFATIMVGYVFVRYMMYFHGIWKASRAEA